MKKQTIAMISLFFSSIVFANSDNFQNLEKKSESSDCLPITKIKPKIKKIKKVTNKENKEKTKDLLLNNQNPIFTNNTEKEKITPNHISENEIFHIPNNIEVKSNQIQQFSNPLKYSDITYTILKNDNKSFLNLIDKRTNSYLDSYYLERNSSLLITNLNLLSLKFSQTEQPYSINNFNYFLGEDNKCNMFFVSYKLKDEKDYYQYNLFHKIVENECLNNLNKIKSQNDFYTNDFNLINISINSADLHNEKINVTLHISKDGTTFFPKNINAFVLKEDLSKFYILSEQQKDLVLGMSFSSKVSPGKYFVILNYEYNNEMKSFKTLVEVN